MSRESDLRGVVLAVVTGAVGVAAALWLPRVLEGQRPDPHADLIALGKAHRALGAKDRPRALSILSACARTVPHACRCSFEGATLADDLARYADALAILDAARPCDTPEHQGLAAEALVGSGKIAEGKALAIRVLAQRSGEPHSSYARAWAESLEGHPAEALPLAEKAASDGRGLPAYLLLATLRSAAGDTEGTRDAVERAYQMGRDDPRVAFDQGSIAQNAGDYNGARSAYLRALALDPRFADARYALAVLTHAAGADAEAAHDLDELAAIAPNDPRIAPLRAQLPKSAKPVK